MKRLKLFIPFVAFILLSIVLWRALFLEPKQLESAMEGKQFPKFELTELHDPFQRMDETALLGQVALINVWGTWCPACKFEHPYLMKLSKEAGVPIYGINYRDQDRNVAINELVEHGNPYDKVIYDARGTLGIDLGVYGAPETYVIDKQGIIHLRHAGPIDEFVWQSKLRPLIQQLKLQKVQERK